MNTLNLIPEGVLLINESEQVAFANKEMHNIVGVE
jgi:nitrogen-specific signal transduction histidine kinase